MIRLINKVLKQQARPNRMKIDQSKMKMKFLKVKIKKSTIKIINHLKV